MCGWHVCVWRLLNLFVCSETKMGLGEERRGPHHGLVLPIWLQHHLQN